MLLREWLKNLNNFVESSKLVQLPFEDEDGSVQGYSTTVKEELNATIKESEGKRFVTISQERLEEILIKLNFEPDIPEEYDTEDTCSTGRN